MAATIPIVAGYIMSIYGSPAGLPVNFPACIAFEWDRGNAMKNLKHDVTDDEAEQVFVNEPLLVVDDIPHSASERRWQALGITNERRLLHVTFTLRDNGTRARIISARPMHRKERRAYEQETQTHS
jgi:uncharacterized DUF497 family protein